MGDKRPDAQVANGRQRRGGPLLRKGSEAPVSTPYGVNQHPESSKVEIAQERIEKRAVM